MSISHRLNNNKFGYLLNLNYLLLLSLYYQLRMFDDYSISNEECSGRSRLDSASALLRLREVTPIYK